MFHIYLPIAEVSVNLLTLMAIGGGVGFLSGLFGVGGGHGLPGNDQIGRAHV